MSNIALQNSLDIFKWLDSEQNYRDMCGKYDFCKCCDKSQFTPCANACELADMQKMSERQEIEATNEKSKDKNQQISSLGKKFDLDKVMEKKANRKSLCFAEKYALADDSVKERYDILKAELLSTQKGTAKIKNRISKQCDTYRRDGDIVAKVTIIGTSLRVNLPLDPFAEEFCDGKTPHVATGHKRVYEHVPFQFKVNSKLAMKRVLKLIELVK